MLHRIRRQSALIYCIFGGIILIFAINFGPSARGCMRIPPSDWAAKVNGQILTHREFAVIYQHQLDYLRRMAQKSGGSFDEALAERLGLRQRLLDQLIDRTLLQQQAQRYGLRISDQALVAYLKSQYGIHGVGYERYEAWVSQTFGSSVSRFEDNTRHQMAAQRMAELLSDLIDVSEGELREDFIRDHDRAMITYARFDMDPHTAPEPDAKAIDALLAEDMPAVQRYADQAMLKEASEDAPAPSQPLPQPPEDGLRKAAQDLLKQRFAQAQAQQKAQALWSALKAGGSWETLTVTSDVTPSDTSRPKRQQSPWISRSQDTLPGLGKAPELHKAVFALRAQPLDVAPRVFRLQDSYVVVALKERQLPDLTLFEKDKASLRTQAQALKRQRILHDWLAYLRKQASLQINPAVLKSPASEGEEAAPG